MLENLKLSVHADRLLSIHKVNLEIDPSAFIMHRSRGWSPELLGCAAISMRLITMARPVQGPETYSVFMHEMGHLVSPNQIRPMGLGGAVYLDELDAWRWARHNSILWTPTMEAVMVKALGTYSGLKGL